MPETDIQQAAGRRKEVVRRAALVPEATLPEVS